MVSSTSLNWSMYINIWFISYTIAACKNTSLEHTAGVTFKAYGRNLNELFENAAEVLESTRFSSMKWSFDKTCTIEIGSDSYENLLYDWLAELLITFEIGRFAVKKCIARIVGLSLTADCLGERLDPIRHRLNAEVKAVT